MSVFCWCYIMPLNSKAACSAGLYAISIIQVQEWAKQPNAILAFTSGQTCLGNDESQQDHAWKTRIMKDHV